MQRKTGVLLLNLGTPDNTDTRSVRRYLRQFLSDKRVIDIPAPARWLLLNAIILPFRPKKSAEAYETIWTDEGSPLLIHTRNLTQAVAAKLGTHVMVDFAMRYQNPSIPKVLDSFRKAGIERLIVVPLYPQYAASSTGSCVAEIYRVCGEMWNTPSVSVVPPFFDHTGYLDSLAEITRESLGERLDNLDYLLISFHGLPERHMHKSNLGEPPHCLANQHCCDNMVEANRYCYRAQSFFTARALAARLGLDQEHYGVCFQSRLGRTPWIQPYTDEVLETLPKQGKKRIAVTIPSFTADCLETLEEIGIRGRESFMEAGGEEYHVIPCLNTHPTWVEATCDLIRSQGLS